MSILIALGWLLVVVLCLFGQTMYLVGYFIWPLLAVTVLAILYHHVWKNRAPIWCGIKNTFFGLVPVGTLVASVVFCTWAMFHWAPDLGHFNYPDSVTNWDPMKEKLDRHSLECSEGGLEELEIRKNATAAAAAGIPTSELAKGSQKPMVQMHSKTFGEVMAVVAGEVPQTIRCAGSPIIHQVPGLFSHTASKLSDWMNLPQGFLGLLFGVILWGLGWFIVSRFGQDENAPALTRRPGVYGLVRQQRYVG